MLGSMAQSVSEIQHRNGYTHVYPCAILALMAKKDVGLRIRVDRGLREAFIEACKAEDRLASEVLRDFMRRYVGQHLSTVGQMRLPLSEMENKEELWKG